MKTYTYPPPLYLRLVHDDSDPPKYMAVAWQASLVYMNTVRLATGLNAATGGTLPNSGQASGNPGAIQGFQFSSDDALLSSLLEAEQSMPAPRAGGEPMQR